MDSLPFISAFWLYVPVLFFMVLSVVTYIIEGRRDE